MDSWVLTSVKGLQFFLTIADFHAQIIQDKGMGTSLKWLLCSFSKFPCQKKTLPGFLSEDDPGSLAHSLHQSWTQSFPQGALALLSGELFKHHYLGTE